MNLGSSYVLGIPDLDRILNQEDIAEWELFLLNTEKRYEKIRWRTSFSEGSFTFQNVHLCTQSIKTVELDFNGKKIGFVQGDLEDKEFEEFLAIVFSQLFIRVNTDRIHFLVNPKLSRHKRLRTRR